MRTSNKILLGGFVATILILVGIHVALYAKYKRGDTKDLRDLIGETVTQDLGNIKIISITGLQECTIIAADTARLQMDKHWKGSFSFRINGDSLVVEGNKSIEEYARGNRVGLPITLHLPSVELINMQYGGLTLLGADSAKATSQKIVLSNSTLQFATMDKDSKKGMWNNLTIDAQENTEINFPKHGTINYLDVTLSNNSTLHDHGVHVESFLLKMDSTSSAALRMHNLDKLKQNKQ